MPLRAQWARAYTKRYRNYGHTTTSPYKSLHASTKSFLRNTSQTLYQLFHALKLQKEILDEKFEEEINHEARRIRDEYRHPLLINVTEKVSWKGLGLMHKQYLIAKASRMHPIDRPIGVCSSAFNAQYGLPYKHTIHNNYLKVEGVRRDKEVITLRALKISWFNNQWIIRTNLDELNPYQRIRDPKIIPRRRQPQNNALSIPQPATQPQLATQSQPMRPSQPASQSALATPQGPMTPTPTRQSRRRGPNLRANNLNILSQAIRGIVRDEITRAQPAATLGQQGVMQQPVIPRVNTQSRTIQRSAASQIEMQRLPSGFECFGSPQSS
ncbi:hypothetical protein EDB80DRAFT_898602 [Ilyonectria destructans]|nr:hypothetical protein EDB80DRAFT_898602 [Ilyonectria destructans]